MISIKISFLEEQDLSISLVRNQRISYVTPMRHYKMQRTMPLSSKWIESHDQTRQLMCNLRKISAKCKPYGIKHVFVSSLLYTWKILENLLVDINRMATELCKRDGYEYIDNDNIPRDMLDKGGLHLLDKGKYSLSRNFIENFNHFLGAHVYHLTVRLKTLI